MNKFLIVLLLAVLSGMNVADAADYTDPATGMEFTFVKGGCFKKLHTEEKPDQICVSDFLIGTYEVTQAQWKTVIGRNPSYFSACGETCPIEEVSERDAQNFMDQARLKTGRAYRLPTEAEWEYAAGSGGKHDKWAGTSSERDLADYAWYQVNSEKKTHPVGQKKPNGLGIYDMSGNVWEWVTNQPESRAKSSSAVSRAAMSGGVGTLRGGSWQDPPLDLEVSRPGWVEPILRTRMVGFRAALSSDQVSSLKKVSTTK